ncbi:hypothetical protein D9757_004964 [Collybiopsis confluens]|uniref:Protein-tyrosine-phosphatase n=1 Tax=Collybiopsis confluens TaxID=2823264 RepID=A0A8H5HTG2_9AGAR|nr:hypothetical protein D9757_004964 [Collybiopsis confluens]
MSELYGLNYGPDFLASLPTVGHLDANSSPSRSIHTLTATQFKDLHFNHILSHPPDSVLFPFLHGIEGDNQAQNLFFATQGQQAMLYNDNKAAYPPVNRAKAPKYRGLMWVICEDDLDNPEKELRILVHRDSVLSEEQYEDSSDSYFDDEDDLEDDDDSSSESFGEPLSPVSTTPYPPAVGMDMELDIQYNDSGDDNVHGHHNPDVVEIVGVGTDEKHMHPVQHRATVLPTPIRTTDLPHHHAKSSTTATSDFSSASTDSSGTEASTALTEFEEEPNVKSSVEAEGHSPPSRSHHHKHSFTYARKAATPPPILTSTFRATDLLRQIPPSSAGGASGDRNETNREPQCGCGCIDDEDSEWEFTPLHVPEGISLRNFGIQVPILASISDIVVYSPNSSGAAKSARALKLARRFKQAVDRKRRERIGCECEAAVEDGQNHTLNDTTAGAADKREMPHMVVKLCPDGQVPGSLGGNSSVTARPPTVSAVLTRSPSTFRHDQDGDVVMSEGGNGQRAELFAPSTSPTVALTHTQRPSPSPNTVDFAQREKDEMRDLTRASEIVSIFPKDHPLAYLNPDPIRPPVHIQASSHHIPNPNPSSNPHPNHHPLTHSHTHSSVASGAPSTNLDSETEDAELDLSSTKTYWDPLAGQIFLGNANDIPLPVNGMGEYGEMDPKWGGKDIVDLDSYPYDDQDSSKSPNANDSSGSYRYGFEGQGYYFPPGNSPRDGYGYDICIECHDLAPFPTMAHLKASEEKIALLEERWRLAYEDARRDRREEMQKNGELGVDDGESAEMEGEDRYTLPPRPPPHPNAIIHLPMPSSPPVTAATMSILMPIVRFLQKCITETGHGMGSGVQNGSADPQAHLNQESKSRRWSSVSSLITSFSGFPIHSNPATPPPPPSLNSSNLMPSSSAPASVSTVAPGTVSGTSRLRAMTIPASITPSTDLYTSTVRIVHHPPPTSGNSAHVPTHQYYSHHSRHPSSSLSYLSSSAYTSPFPWTRPLKILLYSADGYTESSVPALILLMATKGLSLPQAYLDLQVGKRRSFFVYSGDLGVLRKVEGFCEEEKRILREEEERRGREEAKERERVRERERRAREVLDKEKGKKDGSSSSSSALSLFGSASGFGFATHINPYRSWGGSGNEGRRSPSPSRLSLNSTDTPKQQVHQQNRTRPTAKSVSFARSPFAASSAPDDGGSVRESQNQQLLSSHELPTQQDMASMSVGTGGVKGSATLPISSSAPSTSMISLEDTASSSFSVATGHIVSSGSTGRVRRPRASTSPWLPSFFGGDHQSWFNDPRFDGSFPSRVLPFLYLGNLAHASNVYMLQALGITHVVSVGECALVPPDSHSARVSHFGNNGGPSSNHFIPSKTQNQGSLWIEERAGRIKVLDIQGVCDDGIDTLEPQLEPICDWIDHARQEGGQVLVHCRVGVSRSATVTIAYVMKHLSLPLVDAYLIVRSRRLSVLIQPNMRLLYNLLGWEIKLAKERAGEDEDKLKRGLSTALSWPFLAKEVHALNEKYLH